MAQMNWLNAYTTARNGLLAKNGSSGVVGPSGATLPKMSPFEAMELVSWILDDVIAAIGKAGYGHAKLGKDEAERKKIEEARRGGIPGGLPTWFAAVPVVGLAGVVAADYALGGSSTSETITVSDWLVKGRHIPGAAHVRNVPLAVAYPNIQASGVEGFFGSGGIPFHVSNGDVEVAFLIGRWQPLIQATAEAIAMYAFNPSLRGDALKQWWAAYYAMMIAIEVVIAHPRPSTAERIRGGLKYAARTTLKFIEEDVADAAGRVIAVGAATVGKAAGSAASGFFDEAGATAYIVAGVAIFVALN